LITVCLRPISRGSIRRGFATGRASFALAFSRSLEQRIALEFALNISGQIEVGELQQLDGLHQLRRHHERMALPDFESLGERHWR
jgi:hypothetical protein